MNGNGKLTAEEKVQMQSYITGCYGSLTTFNLLFANKGRSVRRSGDDESHVAHARLPAALVVTALSGACGRKKGRTSGRRVFQGGRAARKGR